MRKLLSTFILFGVLSVSALGASKTFSGPGNFSDATKWSGNSLPSAGDQIKINSSCVYDVGTNLVYGNLNLGNPFPGQLTFNAGTTLSVTGVTSAVAGSTAIDMTSGGTLVLTGINGWVANSGFIPGSGTVEIQGAITLPADVAAYNHLTIASGAGTVTLGTATTVNGNLTISSGTLSAGANTLSLKGNWTNAGTYTPGTGTVTFNGSSSQSLTGATTFLNLTLNNGAGLSLNSSATVNGALTLTNGLVTTGANSVIIATTGSVSRTNGYVVGNLRKNVATGATSRAFEVGDLVAYSPVSVTFGNVTTAGNLTASASSGDHPNLATSLLDPAKGVNRYWTLTNSGVVFTNYSATFTFVPGDLDAGASAGSLLVGEYVASNWSLPTVGTRTATTTQATGLTAFGDFALAEVFVPTITATAGANGTISPSGSVSVTYNGSQAFTVTPDTGYHIADVLVDGVSVGAVGAYNFTNVTANHTISASFAVDTLTVTASAGANGTISPSGTVAVTYGSTQSFTLTPDAGYHVADVLVDGVSVGAVSSYDFTGVTANHTISVSFDINIYTITASAGANGSIAPSGAVPVTHGTDQAFTITPDAGYHIADVFVDSVSVGATGSYTFTNVTANHTISASFAINTYTITASAGANGTISPSGAVSVDHGADQTFTITPDAGYHIVDVFVDSVSAGAVTSHTFTNVTANHTISATFAINVYTIAASAGANGSITPTGAVPVTHGADQAFTIAPDAGYHIADVFVDSISVGATGSYTFTNVTANHTISATFAINSYTITASAGANGSISPSGAVLVNHGADQTFTIIPDAGYHIVDVFVDSVSAGAVTSHTFTNVTANHTISATFAINIYTITASAGANGSISPSGAVSVNHGADQAFTITPDAGYHVVDVFTDSVSVGATTSFTFTNVTANHTIQATFGLNAYTITASAGANGSISPSGAVSVSHGGNQSFTIAPDVGFHIVDVFVDSVSVGPLTGYSFTNVTANHAISASFGINSYTITATAGAHGTISPSGAISVTYGDSLQLTISPDSGYAVTDVFVDTVSVGPVSAYTFHSVSANHAINAVFGQVVNPVPTLAAIAPASSFRGSTLNIGFKGTGFAGGVSSVNAVAGIVINTVTVQSTDSLTANVTVLAAAPLGVRNFSVTNAAPGGGTSGTRPFSVINRNPSAVALLAPADAETVFVDLPPPTIDFLWHPSVDGDAADTLRYTLNVKGPGLDTTVAGLTDSAATLGLMSLLQPGSDYRWTVAVNDGNITVASADTFSFHATRLVAVGSGEELPKVFALYQNYPNPFNPSTRVRFDIPQQSSVTLKVYNLLGVEVVRLVDGVTLSAGVKTFDVDGSGLASGVYFYRVEAEDAAGNVFVDTKRMMLVK